jgi:hypothetical protein
MRRLFVLVLSLLLASLAHATQYHFADLGPVIATALDPDAPIAVGSYYMPAQIAAIVYPQPLVLGTLPGGEFSVANYTRNRLTVGYCGTGPFSLFTHACAHTPDQGLQDVGTLGDPALFSAATSCNSSGWITVYGDNPSQTALVPWVVVGSMRVLLRTPTEGNAFPSVINDSGYVIGSALADDGRYHIVLWTLTGGAFDLGPGQGITLNNSDGAVLAQIDGPLSQAGVFRSDGLHVLLPLPGDDQSRGGGLNDHGASIGTSTRFGADFPSEVRRIALWQADDTAVDLTPLVLGAVGWTLEEGRDINNLGLILGEGVAPDGTRHGFLLTPVDVAVASVAPVVPAAAVAVPVDPMPLPVVLATMDDATVLAMAMRQTPTPRHSPRERPAHRH